ncbi:type II toxin-antitoxin system VapC family toxin [Desulfonatronum thiodismutans]|uniref:type II toxin-antitoxin system VapC family toxin n=1 Tax=Desulfonatronum thiodismutans TaxID=159290 RepID=UPI00190F7B84|nr:type II toxin-antitoxin system VapC family toxin [Desulfonatronum thiodismutans]
MLDTHALLWWLTDDPRLSVPARDAIADEKNTIFVSAASSWEIATKQRIGKLEQVPGVVERFAELVAADGFTHLPITYVHSLRAGSYSMQHCDPFDRMLAAQSELEMLPLVTLDPAFSAFHCITFW